MRAVRTGRWGSIDGLEIVELPVPMPAADEVRVRVNATSVTRGDALLRKIPPLMLRILGVTPKRVLGHEFAGVVDQVGSDAVGFAPTARVFGTTSGTRHGAHAEYVLVGSEEMVVELPDNVPFGAAAPVPVGAMTALHLVEEGGVAAGRSVLVNGASGSVGTFAIQIARTRGAHVTAVCSGGNAGLVRSLGADEVVDYTTTDVTALARRFDIIIDAIGKLRKSSVREILADNGRFVTVRSRRNETLPGLMEVRDLLASGALRAVIDSEYELEDIRRAHRLVESGRKRGNVLVRVDDTAR